MLSSGVLIGVRSGCTGDRRGLLCDTQGGQALACPIRSRSGLVHPEDLARALDHLHIAHGRQREAGLAELGLQAGAERGQQHGLPRKKAEVGVEVGAAVGDGFKVRVGVRIRIRAKG